MCSFIRNRDRFRQVLIKTLNCECVNRKFSSQTYNDVKGSNIEIFVMGAKSMDDEEAGYGLSLSNSPCLVLNADFSPLSKAPLSLWNWQDTIKAVMADKVTVLSEYNLCVRGISCKYNLPSVIALKKYQRCVLNDPKLTRSDLFLRDGFRCQYCMSIFEARSLSLDHVIPRSKGGKVSWTNIVTACHTCNCKKGDLLPKELQSVGMQLRRLPRLPTRFELQSKAIAFKTARRRIIHTDWKEFLI